MPVNNVSLMAPQDWVAAQEDIQRRRKLAELMQQQSFTPIERFSTNGIEAPISWTQGLAKMLQAYTGNKAQEALTAEQKKLYGQQQQQYADAATRLMDKLTPQPAFNPSSQDAEDAAMNNAPAPAARPATNPTMDDLSRALMQYTTDIGQPQMGAQYAMQHAQQNLLARQLLGGAPTAATTDSQPAQVTGTPKSMQDVRLPPQMEAALLAVDPSGKELMKKRAELFMERQKPIVNRGFGIGTQGPNGEYQPDPNSLQQIKDVQGVTQAYEAPITLKTSEGREIQLSRPEWQQYQKTNQLPERILGPAPSSVPAGDAYAFNQVRSAQQLGLPPRTISANSIGVPGVSQSQQAQIEQSGQRATADKSGAGLGEVDSRIRLAGMDANMKINKFRRLGGLLESIDTGKLQPAGYELAAYAQSLGFSISPKTDNAQAAKALANEMALELRNPAGGAGMPGNFSDQDRRYLQSIIANVDKTPGANKLLVDGMIKMYERDREIASMATAFKKKHGGVLTDDFFDEVQRYSDSHPLFPRAEQSQQTPQNAGGNVMRSISKSGKPIHSNDGGKTWEYD